MEEKLSKIVGVRVTETTHAAFLKASRLQRRKLVDKLRALIEKQFGK